MRLTGLCPFLAAYVAIGWLQPTVFDHILPPGRDKGRVFHPCFFHLGPGQYCPHGPKKKDTRMKDDHFSFCMGCARVIFSQHPGAHTMEK